MGGRTTHRGRVRGKSPAQSRHCPRLSSLPPPLPPAGPSRQPPLPPIAFSPQPRRLVLPRPRLPLTPHRACPPYLHCRSPHRLQGLLLMHLRPTPLSLLSSFPASTSLPLPPLPTSPAAAPTSPSPTHPTPPTPPPLYTPSELSSLADRYHLFFLSNLIRAYNHLAVTFELYKRHCVSEEVKDSIDHRGIHIQPLTLPPDLLKSTTESRELKPPADEEKKEDNRYLRPSAIDMRSIHQGEEEGARQMVSPSSPSILLLPPHSADRRGAAVNASPPASPLPSPPLTSSTSTSSLPSPPTPDDDSLLQATKRHSTRRRRSFDPRTPSDYAAEQSERAELTALRLRYHIPRLERLSVRLERGGGVLSFDSIARTILKDVSGVARDCFQLWNLLLQMLPLMGEALFAYGKREWEAVCQDHWASFVFRESYSGEHRMKVADDSMMETHTQVAAIARRNAQMMVPPLAIREVDVNPASLLIPGGGTATVVGEVRDRGVLMGDHENQVVVFEETYSRTERPVKAAGEDDDGEEDGEEGEGEDGEPLGVTVDGVEVEVEKRKEIEDIDIDHTAVVSTGVDSRPAPAAVLEAGASADHSVTRTRQSLSMDTVTPPSVTSGLTQPLSATTVGAAEVGRGMSRSGSQPALTLPSIPSSLTPSVSFSSSSSSSATFPTLHKLSNNTGVHVYILCHGYQGNSWDLRSFKHQLSLTFPEALVFLSQANETHTEGDIAMMGQRLALEVSGFINDHCPDSLGRLSFVGHSLGGVIVRAALHQPVMNPYLPYCHSFLSFASPHLGYLYAENPFLTTGLWFLKKWNKSVCLSQLSLTDAQQMEDCYLYRLSEGGELRWFDHVFLLASQQDKYVPFHSARMEMCKDAVMDMGKGGRGKGYEKMVENVMRGMDGVSLKRMDVQFVSKKKGLDSFIGRAAHIFFLDQVGYMQLLVNVYRHYLV